VIFVKAALPKECRPYLSELSLELLGFFCENHFCHICAFHFDVCGSFSAKKGHFLQDIGNKKKNMR
jgi:hypothetical protein